MSLAINIGIVVIFVISILSGYKQGFLWKLISILGFFLVGILAWWLSAPLSEILNIYPHDQVPLAGTLFEGLLYDNLNRLLLFVLVFIVLHIVLFFLKPMVKIIGSLPVVSGINKLLGAVLGGIQVILFMVLACIVLRLPFWNNGNQIIETTLLRYSEPLSTQILSLAKEPLQWMGDAMSSLEDSDTLTTKEKKQIEVWLLSQGIEEEKVADFMESLQ